MDHTGIRPYVCQYPLCSKRFKTGSLLSRHSDTHLAIKPVCGLHSDIAILVFDSFGVCSSHLVLEMFAVLIVNNIWIC